MGGDDQGYEEGLGRRRRKSQNVTKLAPYSRGGATEQVDNRFGGKTRFKKGFFKTEKKETVMNPRPRRLGGIEGSYPVSE